MQEKRFGPLVLFSLLALALSGCASLGNGKLDGPAVDAVKNVDKAALAGAAASAPARGGAETLAFVRWLPVKRHICAALVP